MLFAIPAEPLLHTDEIRTAERSRGFLLSGNPWTVTEGLDPIFAKPPLQYWLTAPLIAWLGPDEYAVRIWPAIFAIGGILSAAWLAALLWPEQRWSAPLASLLVALNSTYLSHGITGLLDSGQAFGFTLLAICIAKTTASPAWWLAGGGIAGLLALQKSPAGFLFLVGFLITAAISKRSLRVVFNPWSISGLCLAFALAVFWPVLQLANFGRFAFDVIFGQQMLNRFLLGTQADGQAGVLDYVGEFVFSWKVCAPLVLCASGIAVFFPVRGAHPALRGLAVLVFLYWIAAAFAKPAYGRYILAVVPIAAAISAGPLLKLTAKRRSLRSLLLFCLVASLPFEGVAGERSNFNADDYASQARIAKHLRGLMSKDSNLTVASGRSNVEPRLFAYYLNLPRTPAPANFTSVRLDISAASSTNSPAQFVVCDSTQSLRLRSSYPSVNRLMVDGNLEVLNICGNDDY